MFTKLYDTLFGRKRMSNKRLNEIRRYVEVEFKNSDHDFAEYMITTNQYQRLMEIQKCLKN